MGTTWATATLFDEVTKRMEHLSNLFSFSSFFSNIFLPENNTLEIESLLAMCVAVVVALSSLIQLWFVTKRKNEKKKRKKKKGKGRMGQHTIEVGRNRLWIEWKQFQWGIRETAYIFSLSFHPLNAEQQAFTVEYSEKSISFQTDG